MLDCFVMVIGMKLASRFVSGLLVVLGLTLLGCTAAKGPLAVAGQVDLTGYPFETLGSVSLDGEWELFWNQFVAPGDLQSVPTVLTNLPNGLWQHQTVHGQPLPETGYATYRLRVTLSSSQDLALRLPEFFSSSRVFLNGNQLFSAGVVGTHETSSLASYATGVVRFPPRVGENEILVQVANFKERRGGINRSISLGTSIVVTNQASLSLAADLLLFGVLLTMGVYHLVLFLLRRQDTSPLWFGLFCLVIAVRTLLYGERFGFLLFPGLPWEFFQVADHLSFYLGIPLFAEFLRLIFLKDMSLWFIRIYQTLGLLFAGFLFFPPSVFNVTVVGYELVSTLALIYLLGVVGLALVRRRDGARITFFGVVLFLLCAVNEIFHNLGIIHTFNTLSLGLVLFLFSQAVLLAIRFSLSFTEAEHLSGQLLDTNKALRRFIPEEFFQLLNAKEVTDIRLGDQVQKTMTVMFSDIRSFTSLAESMSSEQTFHFLNSYYGRAGLVMRQHGGFIDKYFGDGFMTLFPNRPDDALAAAVDLQGTVAEYNVHRAQSGYPPISVGSGLHYGPLVLGTIGEWDRMDTTVISDAVNIASRLEGLTKMYGKGTIVTVGFLDALEEPDRFHWRYLGLLRVQGRKEPVEAVHVYDGVPQAEWDAYHFGKAAFEEALALYRQGDFPEAHAAFTALALKYPEDPACGVYLTRISLMIKAGLTQDWDGVDTILSK